MPNPVRAPRSSRCGRPRSSVRNGRSPSRRVLRSTRPSPDPCRASARRCRAASEGSGARSPVATRSRTRPFQTMDRKEQARDKRANNRDLSCRPARRDVPRAVPALEVAGGAAGGAAGATRFPARGLRFRRRCSRLSRLPPVPAPRRGPDRSAPGSAPHGRLRPRRGRRRGRPGVARARGRAFPAGSRAASSARQRDRRAVQRAAAAPGDRRRR